MDSPDYRVSLRNILNRRLDFDEVGKPFGLRAQDLEDLIQQRAHLPTDILVRLIEHLGGELAVRPEAFPHLAHPEAMAEFAGRFPVRRLHTKGLRLAHRYGEDAVLTQDTDLAGVASWLIDKAVPFVDCQKHCSASSYCPL